MAGEFYRSLHPRRFGKELAKKAAKNKRTTLVLVAGFIAFLYLLFDNKGIITRLSLESQRKELHQQVVTDTSETKKLQSQIKALEGDKKTIEKIAREKYNMSRPGETVYRVKKDDSSRN